MQVSDQAILLCNRSWYWKRTIRFRPSVAFEYIRIISVFWLNDWSCREKNPDQELILIFVQNDSIFTLRSFMGKCYYCATDPVKITTQLRNQYWFSNVIARLTIFLPVTNNLKIIFDPGILINDKNSILHVSLARHCLSLNILIWSVPSINQSVFSIWWIEILNKFWLIWKIWLWISKVIDPDYDTDWLEHKTLNLMVVGLSPTLCELFFVFESGFFMRWFWKLLKQGQTPPTQSIDHEEFFWFSAWDLYTDELGYYRNEIPRCANIWKYFWWWIHNVMRSEIIEARLI